MSEYSNVFPNADSPLLGAGEDSVGIIVTPAVAGLTGSVSAVLTATLSSNSAETGSTQRTTGQSGSTGQSFTITYGEPINVAKIHVEQKIQANNSNSSITIHLRRGDQNGTIIASQGPISGVGFPQLTVTFDVTETDRPVGAQLYTVTFLLDTFVGGVGWLTTDYNPIFNGETALVDIDDTHQGFIETVAVAGKNIITPDSHRTHEQAVLPG